MNRRFQLNRFGLLLLLIVVFAVSAWANRLQQPNTQAPAAADEDANFTGKAFRVDSKGFSLSQRGFEPGARSNWHTHGGAQVLFVREGRLRYQVQGAKMKELALHESTYLPGGIPHWHGAAPRQALTHISVTFPNTAANGLTWGAKVGDEEYSGKGKR